MNTKETLNEEIKLEAQRLNTMINNLSLFTRKTMWGWLPDIASQIGITEERFMVMYELNMQSDRSLKDLAQSLVVSPSSLSVMVNSMVELGVITRIPDSTDRRRVLLRLSTKGEKLFQVAEEHLIEQFQKYLINLPQKDRQTLDDATQMMLQVIERILNRP